MTPTVFALVGGIGLDAVVGELPNRFHPVAWFGRLVERVDRPWQRPRSVGFLVALFVPLFAAGGVGTVLWLVGRRSVVAAIGLGTVVVFVTTSLRSLLGTVRSVGRRAGSDVVAARSALGALAGRSATDLSPGEIRSAALESLAENYVDGLVAPLCWFVLGVILASLLGAGPVGVLTVACAGAVWVKAVNTLDSMVGYPDKPWGTASAMLDDAAMWVPARLGAALLAVALASPAAVPRAREWIPDVASPNSGWPMGVLAAGLDVRLTKPAHYELNPGASLPDERAVDRAVRRVGLAAVLAYAGAGVIAWY